MCSQPSASIASAVADLVVVVADHHAIAADADFADLADRQHPVAAVHAADRNLGLRHRQAGRVADGLEALALMMLGDERRGFGLAVDRLEGAAEALDGFAHQFGRDHRAAGDRNLRRRHVERRRVQALHHGDQHGRHAQNRGHLLALEQAQHGGRIELLDEEHRAAGLERAEGNHAAAAGVEHRHEIRPYRIRPRIRAPGEETRIVGERPVRQHRPLGESRWCRRCTGFAPHRRARLPAAPPAGRPVRNSAAGSSRSTISRTASRPAAAAAPISAIGLPRKLATENRAEAPDCSRT